MARSLVAIALFVFASTALADPPARVRVRLPESRVESGVREVVLTIYGSREGGAPIATETRQVLVDANGSFSTPLASLAGAGERWISVRVPPGVESRRFAVAANVPADVSVEVVPLASISGAGIVESLSGGFRFPDATVQTTAVAVSGAAPQTVSGTTGSAGVSTSAARVDHVHAHGNLAGGSLHANATTSTAGFLSSTDKTKIDAVPTYARTIFVSGGGTAAANGTALITAIAGISGNSASSPFLIKLEPGTYDVAGNGIAMKTYVDIEGSGPTVTLITATRGGASINSVAAAVTGAVNTEIRNLAISNTSSTNFGIGYFGSGSGGTMRITDVSISATGATGTNYGIFTQTSAVMAASRIDVDAYGVTSNTGIATSTGVDLTLRNSTVAARGTGGSGVHTGLQTSSSTAVVSVDGSLVTGGGTGNTAYAVNVSPGDVTVTGSTLRTDTTASRITLFTSSSTSSKLNVMHSRVLALGPNFNQSHFSAQKGANSTLNIATSQVDSSTSGTPKCVHVYDSSMNDLNNVCPTPIL